MIEAKERADLHLQIVDNLKKNVADPLLAYTEQMKKDLKTQYAPIDKAYKNFMDALANSLKVATAPHTAHRNADMSAGEARLAGLHGGAVAHCDVQPLRQVVSEPVQAGAAHGGAHAGEAVRLRCASPRAHRPA